MKKRIKLTLLFGLFVLSTSFISKTSTNKIPEGNIILEIEKIKYDDAYNFGKIIENDVLIAYYFLINGEDAEKGNTNYKIKLYDLNFKYKKSLDFIASKNSKIINFKFNGIAYYLELFNGKKLELLSFSKDGKLLGENRDIKLSSSLKDIYSISSTENDITYTPNIYSLGDFGYIKIANSGSLLKQTQTIEAYNNQLELKWTNKNSELRKESNQILYTSNQMVGILNYTYENKIATTSVNFLNSKTGALKFKINIENMNELSIINCFVDEENAHVYLSGEYLQESGKGYFNSTLHKSLGLFLKKFDFEGQLISTKQFSWDDKLNKHSTIYDGKELIDNVSLYIHKIHRDKDGKIYVIGEQYKNTTYFGLNNINFIEGNKVNTLIFNMAYLIFDKDFKLIKNEIVEKVFTKNYDSRVPASFKSSYEAHLILKNCNYFDYRYSLVNENENGISIYYIDKNKTGDFIEEDEKEICYGSINLGEGDTKTQKKVIKFNSKFKKIYPSSKNNILLLEYFTFKKKLIIRKESLE